MRPLRGPLPQVLLLLAAAVAGAEAGLFSWWPWGKTTTTTEIPRGEISSTTWNPSAPTQHSSSTPKSTPTPASTSTNPAGSSAGPEPSSSHSGHQEDAPTPRNCPQELDEANSKDIINKSLRFILFFGSGPAERAEVPLEQAAKLANHLRWKRNRCIALIVPGLHGARHRSPPRLRKLIHAYVTRHQFNVVAAEWSAPAALTQAEAEALTPLAGEAMARALDALAAALRGGGDGGGVATGVCHAVGVGAGAHLAGHVSRRARQPFQHIVGLEPARGLFAAEAGPACVDALSASDAACVATVRVATERAGAEATADAPVLLAAFEVHGVDAGSAEQREERALALWAEAVRRPRTLVARSCVSWAAFLRGDCDARPTRFLGQCDGLSGRFYLRVNEHEPFSLGVKGSFPEGGDEASTLAPSSAAP